MPTRFAGALELVVDRKETRTYLYRKNHQKGKESGLYHLNASDIAMEIYVTQATSALVILVVTTMHTTDNG